MNAVRVPAHGSANIGGTTWDRDVSYLERFARPGLLKTSSAERRRNRVNMLLLTPTNSIKRPSFVASDADLHRIIETSKDADAIHGAALELATRNPGRAEPTPRQAELYRQRVSEGVVKVHAPGSAGAMAADAVAVALEKQMAERKASEQDEKHPPAKVYTGYGRQDFTAASVATKI